jgi:hypothetical protein
MQGFPSVLLGTTCTSVKVCPKHVELILEINKTVIVASSWCSIFTLPIFLCLLVSLFLSIYGFFPFCASFPYLHFLLGSFLISTCSHPRSFQVVLAKVAIGCFATLVFKKSWVRISARKLTMLFS